jgi:hypothetical protein
MEFSIFYAIAKNGDIGKYRDEGNQFIKNRRRIKKVKLLEILFIFSSL